MTAYELSDQLIECITDGSTDLVCVEQAANMLRQQADRIVELEETIEACYAVQKMQAEEVYKGNDRIAELEKLLEHSVGSDCREMRYIQEIENKDARIAELEKQTKPLSNEEIIKIFNQIWNDGGNTNGVMHRFARAIEDKHGIR